MDKHISEDVEIEIICPNCESPLPNLYLGEHECPNCGATIAITIMEE